MRNYKTNYENLYVVVIVGGGIIFKKKERKNFESGGKMIWYCWAEVSHTDNPVVVFHRQICVKGVG